MAPHAIETARVPGRRLGRRPHDPNRRVLRLADVLTGAVPAHPPTVDYLARVPAWGLYQNDRFGDCGPTSVANSRRLVTQVLGGSMVAPTQDDVFDLYRRSGNPGFDPATDADDNGVVMADMLSATLKGGIGGTRCLAYAQVDVNDIDQCRAAIAIFGFLLLGVDLDIAQQQQTSLWDYRRSAEWGGHACLTGTYTSAMRGADTSVISWAERIGVTDAFWRHQVAEAWVCIWPEHVGTVQFEEGIDQGALNQAYQALTGKPGPFNVAPPAPVPTPPPAPPAPAPAPPAPPSVDPADAALAEAFEQWRAAKGV